MMIRWTHPLILLALLPAFSMAQPYDRIVAFGDSLTDTGRAYALTGGNFPPDPPYFQGRFSDGPVWLEQLAPELGVEFDPADNFAVGGAIAGGEEPVFDPFQSTLLTQIVDFTSGSPQPADHASTLFVIWIGSNDVLMQPGITPDFPIANIASAISALSQAGAEELLLINLPELSEIPASLREDQSTRDEIAAYTFAFNLTIESLLSSWEADFDMEIRLGDANTFYEMVASDPEAYGFTEVSAPCLPIGGTTACSEPSQYVFYDGIHPTTAMHGYFAEYLLDTVFAGQNNTPSAWVVH